MTQNSAPAYHTIIKPSSIWMELPILIGFNLILVASAYLSFNLPFSPVPVTGQTLGVLLIAMAVGRVRGTAVVMAYIAEGAAGLPVFAGGKAGVAALMGPTGGYLMGFIAAAMVVGYLSDKGWFTGYIKSVIAMTLGTITIIMFGLPWLSMYVPTGAVLTTGLVPFIPGAIVKLGIGSLILPTIMKFVGRK